ncbi:MAG: hypothetical protein SAJ37_08630 [Oscillatoria sp. PMC 1068.18]|nr:hypothetical protein [Oscillatoria sp. PMC 1076.18]MEC4988798.1 hypothetical protein [Oscillatoria sp. PMC 1068.18]
MSAVLIAGLWQTPAVAKSPVLIRVGQFIADADLSVQLQSQSHPEATVTLSSLKYKQISDDRSLPAGRYLVTVRANDRILLQSIYGLAAGDRYTLVLYGIQSESTPTNARTAIAQLQYIFGGIDTHSVNGYLPQMRLLGDRFRSPSRNPQVRLLHLAPGVVPLKITLQAGSKPLLSQTLTYANSTQVTTIPREEVVLSASLHQQIPNVASLSLTLSPQTVNDIFIVGGLVNSPAVEVVVANSGGGQ